MKIPLKPRDTFELMAEIHKQKENRYIKVYGLDKKYLPKKYIHWDKLRHLKPPLDLSLDEWWYAIKSKRIYSSKEVTLTDKDSIPFVYNLVEEVTEILHNIDMSGGGLILMPKQITNPEMKDQYYVRSLIEESITSSQLEGASTTRKMAKELLRTGRQPIDKSERMIMNNFITMKSISRLKDEKLSKDLVFHIHSLITDKTLDNEEIGRFRNSEDKIKIYDSRDGTILHVPPNADELESRMKEMCDFANSKKTNHFIHPVIKSIILHFWLAYDHPFCDGNGRTARALFYWSMLNSGYWLFEYISISEIILKGPAKYARAFLYTETDYNDLTYFIIYHLEIIIRAIKSLHNYIERRSIELSKLESRISSLALLNHRQRALISHALNHTGNIYNIKSHQTSHNITYQTARTDLFSLVDLRLLLSNKVKKTWHFQVPIDLETILENLSINQN